MVAPDSLAWWIAKVGEARDRLKSDPDDPRNACLVALTTGRVLIMGGTPRWPLTTKRALQATGPFIELMSQLRSRALDTGWLSNLWPEKLREVVPDLISRRVDVLAIQVAFDTAFDEMSDRQEKAVSKVADEIVEGLMDLDEDLRDAMTELLRLPETVEAITYQRERILPEYADQWWLRGDVDFLNDKTPESDSDTRSE
jgi:hypothetical protein